MNKQLAWRCWLALSVLVFAASSVCAQGYKATLVGRVTDAAGAAIQGATVTVTNLDSNLAFTTTSNDSGDYWLPLLVPGKYRLRVEAPGFNQFTHESVTLEVNQTLRLDTKLEVGQTVGSITVQADATAVDTETPALGQVIASREVLDIPLNGRNYLSLALLAPGVVPAAAGANPHNINGARSDHVNYLLDGVSNTERRDNGPVTTPSIDAIREFKIITNNYSAEYGRLDGGVISVALASGTRNLHGKLFEFLRNDALDARGFFDSNVPVLKRNQFGGVLGGPIASRHTFFFASYEGTRLREGQTRLTRVPTLLERQGIFAAPLRNPATRQPFPANTIPPALINPVASAILSFIPLPNRTGILNFFAEETASDNVNSGVFKVDHYFSDRHQLSARYLIDDEDGRSPFRSTAVVGFGATRHTRSQHISFTYSQFFSSRMTNEARVGFIRTNFAERSINSGKSTSAEVGITGVARGYGLADIVIAGLPEIGDATFLPDEWTDNEYVIADTFALTRGTHTLRTGGDYQRSQHFNLFAAFAGGQIAFLGSFTTNPFADFLLGLPVQTIRQVGTNKSYLFSDTFGFFVQDDWKVKRDLTINLGLRYDLYRPPIEKYDRWANFIPALSRQVTAGDANYPRALVNTDTNNVAPRVGFAYRPFGSMKTVVRGGYGIFYGFDLQYTMYQLLGATAYPFTQLELYQAVAIGNPSLANPFPTTRPGLAPGASSPNGWDTANPTPYTQGWNLTFGHELAGGVGLELSYVGSKGTHESVSRNVNQTIRTPAGNLTPFPGYGRIIVQSLSGNSSYNALQVAIERRFRNGLAMRSNFTWSKAIDTASFGAASRLPQNPNDLRAERGLAEFDRRRVWNSDFVYELPVGRGRAFAAHLPAMLDALVGGWQMNGILRLYDGRPFTPVVSTANAQAGFATRPDRIRSGRLDEPSITAWFDTSAFVVVPASAFRFGNSGRNILIGPGAVIFDASLIKSFALGKEDQRLHLRAEFFNLPNHANFGQPDARIDQPTAGLINSAGPGRQIQFALKYSF